MEDTGMEESLDAGSIPASSIKKAAIHGCSFYGLAGIERQGRGAERREKDPVGPSSRSPA